ncbi:MAG TPA: hypothetical protein VMV90_00045 [Rectinemataceae bacterium]|nr:hypothetical protein [Rectinemataceae bacterium]
MRHEQSGPAAPRDSTPRAERPWRGSSRVLLSLLLLIACLRGAEAAGPGDFEAFVAATRGDMGAAQTMVSSARSTQDKLKASQLYQEASQRYQTIIDRLEARMQEGKDRGGQLLSLLTSALLSKADIDKSLKNYDAVIVTLTDLIRRNPNRFDQANGLIREIIGIRDRYARIATELFDAIKTKDTTLPATQNYIKERTQELQELDPYSNQDILIRISEAILKSQNLRTMRAVMTQGRGLLDDGRYADAIAAYEQGLELYRRQFDNSGYDLRDPRTGQVLTVDKSGRLQTLVVDANGTLLRTDSSGHVLKSPDGGDLPALDAQGKPQTLAFVLAGGRQQLESGQGSVVEYAENLVQGAQATADALRGGQGPFAAIAPAAKGLEAAFASGDPAAAAAALKPVQAALGDLAKARSDVIAAGLGLESLDKQLPKRRDGADVSYILYAYLSYADLFLRGRPVVADYGSLDQLGDPRWRPPEERNKSEGIAGAMLDEYASYLDGLRTAFEPRLQKLFSAGLAAIDGRNWDGAKADFDQAAQLAAPGLGMLDLWKLVYPPESLASLDPADKAAADRKKADYDRIRHLEMLASGYSKLVEAATSTEAVFAEAQVFMKGLPPDAPLDSSLAALDGFLARFGDAEKALIALGTETDGLTEQIKAWLKAENSDDPSAKTQREYLKRVSDLLARMRQEKTELIAFGARLQTGTADKALAAAETAVRAAGDLIVGPLSAIPDRVGLHDPSASRAAAMLAAEEKDIGDLEARIAKFLAGIDAESPEVRADPAVQALRAELATAAAQAADLQHLRSADLAKALDHKRAAEKALAAAGPLLAEARRLLTASQARSASPTEVRQDLDLSKARLASALARILEWSNNDFDLATWTEYYNNQYGRLKAERDKADDAYVLNETFALLDAGQRYYNQQLYDQAGEALDSAQSIWMSKHSQEQPQVRYWQNFVKMAQDTNNKREVKPSDPLYYDISNYLSQARTQYVRGSDLMQKGDRTAAAAAFDAARQNISYVTRAFPLNAEAGLLTLQILKATDQAAYLQSLPSRIQAARDLLATDPQTAYSRIADLAKMESGNASIQSLLKEAEIKTGRRPPEPTREQIARAAALVAQAENLMKTGRSSDNAKAADLLNQAYALDPRNPKAFADIKYLTVLSGRGGQAGPGLNPADQALLDTATSQYASGQYNQARDTINRLLQAGRMTRDVVKLDQNLKQLGY